MLDLMNRRTLLRYVLQLSISLGLVAAVVWWTGPREVVNAVRGAEPRWLLAGMLIFVLVPCVHGLRWWVLLRPVGRVPVHETVLIMLAAKAVGILVPFRAGAVLQVQLLGRRYEMNRAAVAGTLVLEAVLDATCFLVLFLIAAPLVGGGPYVTGGIWLMAGIAVIAFTGLILLARRRQPATSDPVRPGIVARLGALMLSVRIGFEAVRSPAAVATAAALTLLDWSLATVGFSLIGRGFGLDVALPTYLLVEIVANLAGAVPFTQSGIGPFEVVVSQVLAARGVPSELAGSFAVGAHALLLPTWLVAGTIALLVLRVRPGEVLYLRSGEASG
jgi:uncharacterized membrane protein YbhN (UPF0104 family)